MANMTKKDIRNGMFGVVTDGDVFVVAGDKLIYDGGKFDNIDELTDDLRFDNHEIIELHEAQCFNQVKEGRSKLIWKREEEVEEEEKGENTITITEEKFFEAVKSANEMFFKIGKTAPTTVKPEVEIMMGLQNITFGELIGMVLFNKENN